MSEYLRKENNMKFAIFTGIFIGFTTFGTLLYVQAIVTAKIQKAVEEVKNVQDK